MARNFRIQAHTLKSTHFTLRRSLERLGDKPTRWKIVIAQKLVPLATQRNRWRRRVKEILRKQKGRIQPGFEMTLKLYKSEPPLKFSEMERQISQLIDKSGVTIK